MQVICIDGQYEGYSSIPEGVPLEVKQSTHFEDFWIVVGYEFDNIHNRSQVWHKRRFIPISDIDETELIKQRQEYETTV